MKTGDDPFFFLARDSVMLEKHFCSEREGLTDSMKTRGFPHGYCQEIVFPEGVRKEVAANLRFLRKTGLSDTW